MTPSPSLAPPQSPACNVQPSLLAARDVFKSGCPGSLMSNYLRCGAAISESDCAAAGTSCAWSDGGRRAAAAAPPARRLSQVAWGGAPRACMPRQLAAMEAAGDYEEVKRALKKIGGMDPAGA